MIKVINQVVDPIKLSQLISSKNNPVILDSQTADRSLSRYAIISFDPVRTIKVIENQLLVNGKKINSCPFTYIDNLINSTEKKHNDLIFNGGFIGTISYQILDTLFTINLKNKARLPKLNGGIYEQAIIIDYEQKTTTLFNLNGDIKHLEEIVEQALAVEIIDKEIAEFNLAKMKISKSDYLKNVEAVKDYIKSGDVYEINYTTGYDVPTELKDFEIFNQLKLSNPAPFAAYLKFKDYSLISASPELFYKLENNLITTQPMKGTASRSLNPVQDQLNLQFLKDSEKDKSELTMIIDLMRNDLSKICQYDSVIVDNPFMIKKYPTVYQQVSDVCGKLKVNVSFAEIFKSLFPSGSITGAPKLRSIEVIDELETRSRENYTGAIGFFSYNQKSVFNVAIRTIELSNCIAKINVGGAIVWDSIAESEYQECQIKAKALLNVLGYCDE